jgi:putative transposase
VWAELRERGWVVGVNRVARIMADNGLQGRCGRIRRHHLTRQAKVTPDIPDLVRRDFTASAPDRLWCTDLTYVPTGEGWLYLAVIIDVFSRTVVGWAADDHMRTELVLDAWRMAAGRRRPGRGLIVHSDRGSQYTSQAWLDTLDSRGQSVDGAGRLLLG